MGSYALPKNIDPSAQTTDMRMKFVEGLRMGMMPVEAARYAGSTASNITSFVQKAMSDPYVKAQLAEIQKENEEKHVISRQKVTDIVIKAIDMADLQGLPGDMLRGAAELNKMNGYYAPEKKEITTNSAAGRVQSQFESMDQDELLEMVGQERSFIEVEFELLEEEDAG